LEIANYIINSQDFPSPQSGQIENMRPKQLPILILNLILILINFCILLILLVVDKSGSVGDGALILMIKLMMVDQNNLIINLNHPNSV